MGVRSEPLKQRRGPSRPSPALVPRGCVITAALMMLRVIAIVLIVVSTAGNYVQFAGGWESFWPPHAPIVAYAVLYQATCSLFQWGFKAMHWWIPYGVALIASAIPSFLTYAVVIGPALTTQLGTYPTIIVVLLFVIAGDALPEWVLVE